MFFLRFKLHENFSLSDSYKMTSHTRIRVAFVQHVLHTKFSSFRRKFSLSSSTLSHISRTNYDANFGTVNVPALNIVSSPLGSISEWKGECVSFGWNLIFVWKTLPAFAQAKVCRNETFPAIIFSLETQNSPPCEC